MWQDRHRRRQRALTGPTAPPLAVHPLGAVVQPPQPRRGHHWRQPLPNLNINRGFFRMTGLVPTGMLLAITLMRPQPRPAPRLAHPSAADPNRGRFTSANPSTTDRSTRPPAPEADANEAATDRSISRHSPAGSQRQRARERSEARKPGSAADERVSAETQAVGATPSTTNSPPEYLRPGVSGNRNG